MKGRALAAVLLLAAAASRADAQGAERPEVRVGDQWRFAVYYTVPTAVPSRTWRVTAVSDEGIEIDEGGEPVRLTRELNVLDSPRTREANPRLLSFPLAVGQRWRYATEWLFKPKASRGRAEVEVVVVAHEKVRVPAGEFEAFRLTSTETLGGTSPIGSVYAGQATRTYWYAPSARAVVKMVAHSPYIGSSTVELVELQLQH